jgi:hypothetical protein
MKSKQATGGTMAMKGIIFSGVLFFMAAAVSFGQSANTGREMSVEESYLQESVEMTVIREYSSGTSREGKQLALDYIGEYIKKGNKDENVRQVLENLALDGIQNKITENGKITNNFPDIRAQAVRYLGELGTREAQESIYKVMKVDKEPNVQYEAIHSLTKIGIFDSGMAANALWVFSQFDMAAPDNRFAVSLLDLIKEMLDQGENVRNIDIIKIVRKISESPDYTAPVRQQARNLLRDIQRSGS